jgi:hypothetical protein
MTDILTNSGLKRPGDLITADKEYCYIFLNACPQAVMLATLDRILGRSADDIFDDVRFVVKSEEFHSSLDALTLIAGRAELPDYSSLFAPQPVSDETPIAASSTSVVPLHASTDGTGDTGAGRAAGYAGAYSGEVKSIRSAFPKESTEQPRTVNPFAGDSSLPASRSQTPRSAPTPIGRMAPPRASRSKSS